MSIRITAAVVPGGHLEWSVGEELELLLVCVYVHPPPPYRGEEQNIRGHTAAGSVFLEGRCYLDVRYVCSAGMQ